MSQDITKPHVVSECLNDLIGMEEFVSRFPAEELGLNIGCLHAPGVVPIVDLLAGLLWDSVTGGFFEELINLSSDARSRASRAMPGQAVPGDVRTASVSPTRNKRLVHRPGVTINTFVDGIGPVLVILPSCGRDGGEDFDDITARLAHEAELCCGPSTAVSQARQGR